MRFDPVPGFIGNRAVFTAVAVAAVLAVALALLSQHAFDMPPCPWCILQRLIFLAIAIVALPGAICRMRSVQAGSAILIATLAAAGVAAAAWQHFIAAKSRSCNFTLADRIISRLRLDSALPEIFEPKTSCADAAATLLGIPYEFYSLALFVLLAALAIATLLRPPR